MYKVASDLSLNRLYITLSGTVSVDEAKECAERIANEVSRLKPGYDVITNISYYKTASNLLTSVPILKKVMELFERTGVSNVIRVVGKSKAALMEFAQASIGAKKGYKIIYVPSVEDAEKKLLELRSSHILK